MLLCPKKTKYKKQMRRRGNFKRGSSKATVLVLGNFGLVVLEPSWIFDRSIEACRLTLTKAVRQLKDSRYFIKIFPDVPHTKKPTGVRMGKGKGEVVGWKAMAKKNRIIFELKLVGENSRQIAKKILRSVSYKIGAKTAFVEKIGSLQKVVKW